MILAANCVSRLYACQRPISIYIPVQVANSPFCGWTAPTSGRFLVHAAFQGLDHKGPTTTDIHILVNGTKSFLHGPITSYRLPLRSQIRVSLQAGETIDLAVGFGKNANWACDSTGIQFKVTPLESEESLALPVSDIFPAQEVPAADYDAVKDFSSTSNPNGVWSYGWKTTLVDQFQLYTDACSPWDGISAWIREGCDSAPYLLHNDTKKQECNQDVWCLPLTRLLLHPGPNGEVGVLRWTAPSTGKYLIRGTFTGLDFRNITTTDVHILVNSIKSWLSGPISSYKQPLTFRFGLWLAAGSTVDFVVGFGNGNYKGDSTGVRFEVKQLGP